MTDAPRPRIRTAAIVWGIVIAGLSAAVIWFVLDPARVTSAAETVLAAGPGTFVIGGVGLLLVIGVIILIGSLLSVVHRAQDRAAKGLDTPASPAARPAEDRT